MATCRVQISIPHATGFASDVVTNTLHFNPIGIEPIDATRCAQLFSVLQGFYGSIYNATAVKSMANYMNPLLTVMKAYDLTDPKPRTAVLEEVRPITAGTLQASFLPAEAAAVLSYRTNYESGTSKASQRGRIYLGGLGDSCIDTSIGARASKLKDGFITAVIAAQKSMLDAAVLIDWEWKVYSEKLNEAFRVEGGWVDNAIDTQRRRGQSATSRTLWVD